MSLGYVILILTIYVLAIARVTRLVNADTILDAPRLAIARRAHSDDSSPTERRRWTTLLYFVQCPWCVGMWIALATAILPVLIVGWPWWAFLPTALATSHLVGVCARWADTEDISIENVDAG